MAKYRRYLLPLTLGLLGLILLIRLFLISASVLVPEDSDIVVLVTLLSTGIVLSVYTIVRISMKHLHRLSTRQARQKTLAEHSRFIRRLDHELKNPLTALRTGLKTLEMIGLPESQQKIVSTMEVQTVRLTHLLAELRKVAELETHPLNLQPVAIETFIANLVDLEAERFTNGGRLFRSEVISERPFWVIDEDLLSLAILNLLDNAFKYTESGDKIDLIVSARQKLTIQINDSGKGIKSQNLNLVWEELYRAESDPKIQGSGIGLALVKIIVERHQGAVTIESQLGTGTNVTLYLPPLSQM